MKVFATAFVVCLLIAGLGASQNPPQQTQQQNPTQQAEQKPAPEITLTGCLIQGSAPSIFVFENARKDPKSTTEAAVKYVVVASTEDLNLRGHVNHQVQITGLPDGKIAPPTAAKVEEKDLPKLSAKAVTMVSDTCAVPTR